MWHLLLGKYATPSEWSKSTYTFSCQASVILSYGATCYPETHSVHFQVLWAGCMLQTAPFAKWTHNYSRVSVYASVHSLAVLVTLLQHVMLDTLMRVQDVHKCYWICASVAGMCTGVYLICIGSYWTCIVRSSCMIDTHCHAERIRGVNQRFAGSRVCQTYNFWSCSLLYYRMTADACYLYNCIYCTCINCVLTKISCWLQERTHAVRGAAV